MKLARCSFKAPYECQKPWPDDCGVQAGDEGLVLDRSAENGHYTTAFFEAFPTCNGISTFIRGEGATVAEAEAQAFVKYEKYNACTHEVGFDRRSYTNGAGFCKGCGMFASEIFEPTTKCIICDTPTNYSTDRHGHWYCEAHRELIKEEDKSEMQKSLERSRAYLQKRREEQSEKQAENTQL